MSPGSEAVKFHIKRIFCVCVYVLFPFFFFFSFPGSKAEVAQEYQGVV